MRLILFEKKEAFARRLLREKCVSQYWFHGFHEGILFTWNPFHAWSREGILFTWNGFHRIHGRDHAPWNEREPSLGVCSIPAMIVALIRTLVPTTSVDCVHSVGIFVSACTDHAAAQSHFLPPWAFLLYSVFFGKCSRFMSLPSWFRTHMPVVSLTQSAHSAGKRSTTTQWMNSLTD